MLDNEKVIKGLECCMKWTGEPNTATCHCSDCSYTNMDIFGQRCLIDLINDALALLKEQKEKYNKLAEWSEGHIVFCKDCRFLIDHYGFMDDGYCRNMRNEHNIKFKPDKDWFCADGERR